MTIREYLNDIARRIDIKTLEEDIADLTDKITNMESNIGKNIVLSGGQKLAVFLSGFLLGGAMLAGLASVSGATLPIIMGSGLFGSILGLGGLSVGVGIYINHINDENCAKRSHVASKQKTLEELKKQLARSKSLKQELRNVKENLPLITKDNDVFSRRLSLRDDQINFLMSKDISLLCILYLSLEGSMLDKINPNMPSYLINSIRDLSNDLKLKLEELQKHETTYQRKRRSERRSDVIEEVISRTR